MFHFNAMTLVPSSRTAVRQHGAAYQFFFAAIADVTLALIGMLLLSAPTGVEASGVTKYLEGLKRSSGEPAINESEKVEFNNKKLDLMLFNGDVFAPIREGLGEVDGYILSTNIQLNYCAENPNIQPVFRKALPKVADEQIAAAFKSKNASGLTYGDGFLIPEVTGISSGPTHFCFVVTDDENGLSYQDRFSENNLSIENIATAAEKCFVALAPVTDSILLPLIGASQISRGDNTSKISQDWARDKHICRRQKAILGIMLGLTRALTKIPADMKLTQIGIVIYDRDLFRAIPDTRDANNPYLKLPMQAWRWAFKKGVSAMNSVVSPGNPPVGTNNAQLDGQGCENIKREK